MIKSYVDSNLIQNSALACFLLTTFVRRYQELTAATEEPDFFKLLLVLPVLWHKQSCDAIKRRQAGTPLHAVLAEVPLIRTDFSERMKAFTAVTGRGLNLACCAGLLHMYSDTEEATRFSVAFSRWPNGSRPSNAPPEMLHAIERLAVWYSSESTAQLYNRFLSD
ncbi:three component ABC system middle component [Paraburkholderia phenazinium]|jgi:hypothetical protein|uniref:three component ABC system middle component n=1 Tax=Paraburkholderia acidicola TaxID=1912599 RepID=UPI000FB338C1